MDEQNKNNELTLNVTGWLHNLLEQGMVNLPSNQAEYVIQAKMWLSQVNQSHLLVTPAPAPEPDNDEET